jgi:hypothetical protein
MIKVREGPWEVTIDETQDSDIHEEIRDGKPNKVIGKLTLKIRKIE